jgi:hypothetical protein
MRGLDPAIHHLERLFFGMDARVKPGNDEQYWLPE